ncbi:heparan-alpha-glucosaminide N-acetyltransferase domain-containing protein [Brevundimonas kwangchunensis]|uniref:Heparan-alpha-glucosaminide N-acetyltransferase domain-containing protein n=1 Tax=Brevundimonas kwangchunensis TaxID=322163 RepID=A0ABN1GLH2_9CAUL
MSLSTAPLSSAPPAASTARIPSIDALRGLVILLMLVDHAREFFFIHAQVPDPMDVATTSPALFFTRLAAHLCAPVFVALTGLGAWLYASKKGGASAASGFLFKRGLFLVFLELTVVNFAWNFDVLPPTIFLQVIWAIGLSMIVLSALVWLPRPVLIAVGLIIVLGHNLLTPITIPEGQPGHAIWAVLHDRGFIQMPWGGQVRTSYPLLPWIGIAALGYAIGPWFKAPAARRLRDLTILGLSMLALFAVLRAINIYGEPLPWSVWPTPLQTVMSVFNLTKYPPSADFILLTLGVGTLLLAAFEVIWPRLIRLLAVYGGAPLFFYLIHLYGLHLAARACLAIFGANQGEVFGVPNVGWVWAIAVLAAIPSWFACRWFAGVKRRSGQWWMKYL